MSKLWHKLTLTALLLFFSTSGARAADYFNGFEIDTFDWNNFGGTISRVISGQNSINSATGNYHAEITGPVFSRYGAYTNAFPSNGYLTSIDIYLDMNLANGSDQRIDFSSAINNPAGNHRRDFIFHLGTLPGENPTHQWVVSASNNAPGWPNNPSRNPILLTESGWYTFEHVFRDNGTGVLEVELSVKKTGSSEILGSWILSNSSDEIGVTVGGNRYGWFVNQPFSFLAIDNVKKADLPILVGPPTDKNQCKSSGWQTFNNPSFKNQGDCISHVQSSAKAVGNRK